MEIFLIRHTAVAVERNICYGQSDVDLQDNYTVDFERIKNNLNLTADYRLISSPAKRCTQLAEYLCPGKVETDARILEMNFGEWELKPWDQIDQTKLNVWMDDFVNCVCPGGESFKMLEERVKSFFQDRMEEGADNLMVVTHAGAIRTILSLVLEIPLSKVFRLDLKYGSISLLKKNNDLIILKYFNL